MTAPDQSPRAPWRTLRARLLLLAASGLVPLLVLLAWGFDYMVEERRLQAERSALELSRAMATAVDAKLHSIAALLDQLGTSDDLDQRDLRAFHLAARRAANQLGWREVVLTDAQGRVLLRTGDPFGTSAPGPIEPKSVARVIETQAPYVSQIVETPQHTSAALAVRVPVMRSGKLVYVLSAVVPTEVILAVLTRQLIPADSVAAIFDQNYHRVARSRPAASPFPSPTLQAMLDRGEPEGVGRTVTLEGMQSYGGYTRLKDSGWVVAVGTSIDDARQELYALLGMVALGVAGSLGISMLLAWVLSRRVMEPISALKEGAAALGRGEPVHLPQLDVAELDDVAVALENAAAHRDRAAVQVAQALRMAEDANRSKDQFLAMLGHELRNPLAPIATAVQLMALKGDDTTMQERRVIERQLGHVTRLVDDLLDVSRITSGRLAISHEPVQLAPILAQVVDAIRPSLHQRSVSLELAPGMDGAWVAGDEVRLVQVFNNLLVNAIKFTPAGGSIRVRASVTGREAQVEVEDTGVGIPPAELGRIFELFYQAPQSSDRARGGMGLGLPIVKNLVDMHGGSVHAASEGPGQGTRMTVRLPLCEPPAASQDVTPAPAVRGAGTVLVVDDNEDAADTCAALLELSGYNVRVAYTPQAALEVLREVTPDVAVLDIGLPGMSGYELAALMKGPSVGYRGALVAVTGYGQKSDLAASQQAGFDAHLTKPVEPSQLLDLIGQLARRLVEAPGR